MTIPFPNDILKPLWKPYNPALPALPSLPQQHDIKIGCVLVPPMISTSQVPRSLQAKASPIFLSSSKRKRLAEKLVDKPAADPDQGTPVDYDFSPLPRLDYGAGIILDPIIQPVPPRCREGLSRPQAVREPEPEGRKLPISIHYKVFARRVDLKPEVEGR
ncbi:hypothetical protein BDN72DRAFT_841507 [Pluteus cervinus]|uniref:Uncharacterized protein n=1 Tax=Pluteus cervinus TaxID=181527 RepID=A0ACD3ARX6_9AGAR|nr:hypothetical protein BDN72DRAFT_841507 [Pluteus cervinus]